MEDLISKGALFNALAQAQDKGEIFAIIQDMPTVDAEPVRHGHWDHLGGDEWCCSNCDDVIFTEGSWEAPTSKYCSNCGAKMDEVSE